VKGDLQSVRRNDVSHCFDGWSRSRGSSGLEAVASYVVTGEGVFSRKSDRVTKISRGASTQALDKLWCKIDSGRTARRVTPPPTSRRLPCGYRACKGSGRATPDQDIWHCKRRGRKIVWIDSFETFGQLRRTCQFVSVGWWEYRPLLTSHSPPRTRTMCSYKRI
jgi:hypothetical protein